MIAALNDLQLDCSIRNRFASGVSKNFKREIKTHKHAQELYGSKSQSPKNKVKKSEDEFVFAEDYKKKKMAEAAEPKVKLSN